MFARSSFFILFLTCFFSVSAQEPADSVMYQRDSAIISDMDATTLFFQQAEKTKTPEKFFLVTKAKKTVTLKKFIAGLNGDLADAPLYADHAFSDLDKDGKNELLIWNYTGGAHCCDEIYIFRSTGANKYQHVAKLFGGHTTILSMNEFWFGVSEYFGYFFSCYSCGLSNLESLGLSEIGSFGLMYKKGRLELISGDENLRKSIIGNLEILSKQPYFKIDSIDSDDNGMRKEFATNLAVWHFAFGRNIAETLKLFNKYYKFPDAKKVWVAFTKNLAALKADNDF